MAPDFGVGGVANPGGAGLEFPKEDIQPVNRVFSWVRRLNWALIGIVLIGLALRLWGIGYGLPYTYRPDEPTMVTISLRMLQTGDLNPHWLGYPSLMFYMNALVYAGYFLFGRSLGLFTTISDIAFPEIVAMGIGYLETPELFLLGRGLSALFGVGSILITYLIGRQLALNKAMAIMAAGLLPISPIAIPPSQNIAPDTFALFFLLLSFLGTIRVTNSPSIRNYALAGIGGGLAISSKYNAVLILLPLLLAHSLHFGVSSIRRKEIYLALLLAGIVFALSTPYAFLDLPQLVQGINSAAIAQTDPFIMSAGTTPLWYILLLWQSETIMFILAICQIFLCIVRRSKSDLVLLIFPIAYFLFVNQFPVRNERTILLIIPFLDLLAVQSIYHLYRSSMGFRQLPRRLAASFLMVLGILIAVLCLREDAKAATTLTQVDGREFARQWMESNLLSDARFALESYSPYLDTNRFVIQGLGSLSDHTPEWYLQNGFEYLVTSHGMYGRLADQPERFRAQLDGYSQLFTRFPQLRCFNENNYEICIYKTNVVIPRNRVAARYGDYGELVELVGYDDIVWEKGEPLKIKMTWRTLGEKPEPFQVSLRLLDQNEAEIAMVREDLFQGRGWRSGMFEGTWICYTAGGFPAGCVSATSRPNLDAF